MTDVSGNGHQQPIGAFGLVQQCPLAPQIAIIPSAGRPGKNDVLFGLETVIGSLAFVLTPDFAEAIGRGLLKAGREAALNLTIVGDTAPHDDQPGGGLHLP